MSRGQWDAALATLDAALADKTAAALDAAQAARTEALTGQAAALWKEACRSAADRDAARAVALLRCYQAHPAATEPDRAQRLERELTHASDDAAAATLLAGLTDDDLAAVAAGAIPLGVVTDAAARAVFAETLGRNLPAEQRRRAERTARLRTNPAFRELLGFAEAARTRRRAEAEQAALAEQKLAIAFRELGVEDPAEQQKIRAESLLVSGEDWPAVVARKREEAKARFRSIPEVVAGDAAAFERAVDGELDQLLEELRSAAEGRGR